MFWVLSTSNTFEMDVPSSWITYAGWLRFDLLYISFTSTYYISVLSFHMTYFWMRCNIAVLRYHYRSLDRTAWCSSINRIFDNITEPTNWSYQDVFSTQVNTIIYWSWYESNQLIIPEIHKTPTMPSSYHNTSTTTKEKFRLNPAIQFCQNNCNQKYIISSIYLNPISWSTLFLCSSNLANATINRTLIIF